MSKFVLTAQLQLQAPTNTRQVVADLRNQLAGGLNVPLTVSGAAKAQKQINNVTKSTKQATSAAQNMGKSFGLAFKRFAAFTVASRAVSLFTNTLANSVEEAIDFQKEMVKISQVTGKAMKDLRGLERTIFHLATTLGVSSRELLSTTRILSQAGIKAKDLDTALAALAKTTLAPTFEDINKTAEGAIAILAQFGQGVGALESQLGSINAVAGQFAVESGDLIGAIRRTGGVFREAGGSLEEFLGLFTSIRATTRESSESIATGLRTIFTRLQRPRTLEFLRQYGVELQDLEGRFVGPNEAVKRLNAAIGGLDQGDITFIKIAEEIAGFRQIGKVIPLLKEYELAERARQAAVAGGNSLAEDAATAQQSLAVQILKVKQEFQELIQGISNTNTFQAFVKTSLNLASALIKVADAIKPLIPLIAGLAAFKFARGLGGFASGLGGALSGASGKNQGGKILAFARGGMVPGQGNRDTVPAMLSPGEFVIRKSSVNKMGAGNLAAMNANRYADGGTVHIKNPEQYGAMVMDAASGADLVKRPLSGTGLKHMNKIIRQKGITQASTASNKELKDYHNSLTEEQRGQVHGSKSPLVGRTYAKGVNPKGNPRKALLAAYTASGAGKPPVTSEGKEGLLDYKMAGPFPVLGLGGSKDVQEDLRKDFEDAAGAALKAGANAIMHTPVGGKGKTTLGEKLDIGPVALKDNFEFKIQDVLDGASATMEGFLLEAVVGSLGGLKTQMPDKKATGIRADFDFPQVTKEARGRLKALFEPDAKLSNLRKADAKRSRSTAHAKKDGSLANKVAKDLTKKSEFEIKMAKGGAVGSDTVPALLTPGEFVLNKSSAQSIGYNNLSSMNKSGVAKFNKGGAVGVQRFAKGGGVGVGTAAIGLTAFSLINSQLQELGTTADGTRNAFGRVTDILITWGVGLASVVVALKSFGVTLTTSKVLSFFGTGAGSFGSMISGLPKQFKAFATGLGAISRIKPKGVAAGASMVGATMGVGNMKAVASQQALVATSAGKLGAAIKALIPAKLIEIATTYKAIAAKKLERVSMGGKRFMQGFGGTSPRLAGGRGRKSRMHGLGAMAKRIPGAARLGAAATSATGALGAAGGLGAGAAAAAPAFAAMATAAGPILAAVLALKLLSSVVHALVDLEGQKADAIRAGNEAEAGRIAAMQNFDGFFGGLEQGLASAASNEAGRYGQMFDRAGIGSGNEEKFQLGVTHIVERLTGDFDGALRKSAIAQAAAAQASLDYADNARTASRTLKDIKAGRVSASEGFDDLTANLRKQGEVAKKAKDASDAAGEKEFGIQKLTRNANSVYSMGRGNFNREFAGTRNKRIDEVKKSSEAETKKFQQQFDQDSSAFEVLGKQIILTGGGLAEFKQELKDLGLDVMLTDKQMESLEKNLEIQKKAIDANIKFIEAMNFGLRDITAAANAAAISMDNVAAAGQAGFNSFSASASVLESSVTASGKNISDADMDTALSDLESSMRKFGADDKQIAEATGTVGGLRTAQGNAGAALDAAKKELTRTQELSPANIKTVLGDELLKGVEGPAKEKLKAAIENMKIDEEMQMAIKSGNLDKVLEKTLDPVAQAASEQALALLKKRAEVENKLISAISNRQKQEQEYIAAQKQAIDIQLEASKAFEEFGGAAVTAQQKLGARISQANLSLGAAGVGGLASGGAGDIRRALSDVRSISATQNSQANVSTQGRARGLGTAGAFEGAEGLDADKRDEAKDAQKALVQFTKQRLDLVREELKIAEQKNKAEKDALNKLLGGDIEGFLEQQIAAAAGSALKTGDAGLAGAFGAGALGSGFKTLEGQGLSDRAMERAASLSLSSVGVSDPRSAQVLAGNTAEEEALKSEGRELAQVLGEAGQLSADLERMDVTAATVVIQASRIAMDQFQNQPQQPQQPQQGLARGGVVNRGAVRAGNNLSVLKTMNGGGGAGAAMSRGGLAGGADISNMVENGINATSDGIKQNVLDPLKSVLENPTGLKGVFTQFDQSVQKLIDFQLNVKVDPTNVTVNFQGSSFLAGLKDDIRNELLEKVKESIGQAKFNESGELEVRSGKV